jgi:hypothetical protein
MACTTVGSVFDKSLVQGLLLLAATAVLTGLLVPWIKGRVDDRKFREQKVFEAELARQSKVIESQAKLLEDLSDLLWAFLLLSLEVTYYAQQHNESKFDEAWLKYDNGSWEYFGKIRAALSRARRLTSQETLEALTGVFESWFMGFDLELTQKARAGLEDSDPFHPWRDLHRRIMEDGFQRVDGALTDLAQELQLVGAGTEAPSSPRSQA